MLSKNRIKYIRALDKKKFRDADAVFVAEGHKLVDELLGVFPCVYLAATAEWISKHSIIRADVVDEVSVDELQCVSFQETPQQVLAIFRQPRWQVDVNDVARKNLCLVLDDVQNPGNVGTIVRLADWFGIEHIFCSHGTADLYNPKTVQATMGALARVQVHVVDVVKLLESLDSDIPVYGTSLEGENIYSKTLADHALIVMGNEGRGVSDAVEAKVTERLYIPNYPVGRATSESLNVAIATAVVCAEFRRRQNLADMKSFMP